ncbi:MAG: 6,7-dimethyl-8-ribityllumazine synthase [Acidobacteriota bacterium]
MKNPRIALLSGSFHEQEAHRMIAAARQEAVRLGLEVVHEVKVPGSMEKPLALRWLLEKEEVDAVAVLGIIEQGETKHGFVMAQSVIAALVDLGLEHNKPVGVGILGPEIKPSQIESRLDGYAKKSVSAAHRMLELKKELA